MIENEEYGLSGSTLQDGVNEVSGLEWCVHMSKCIQTHIYDTTSGSRSFAENIKWVL